MLIVGSTALEYYGLCERTPKDLDIIGTPFELMEFMETHKDNILLSEVISVDKHHLYIEGSDNWTLNGHIEWEIAWHDSTGLELISLVEKNCLYDEDSPNIWYANPDVCLTLKLSHRYRKNFKHFKKTLDDILFLRKEGADVPGVLLDWLKKREAATYTNKHPVLKQSKEAFFDTPGVIYKYDHDSIHRAIARFDVPCYEYFKDDKAEVFCSKEKFFSLDEKYKLGSVVEESIILALERCLIPHHFETPSREAFLMGLEKVCTSISSGWWREYSYDRYYEAIALFDEEYYDFCTRFIDGIQNGVVKLHTEEEMKHGY